MGLYFSMSAFLASKYSKVHRPLIGPAVSGNFVFSPPYVPSSHSVLPLLLAFLHYIWGQCSHYTPAAPTPWFKTTKFYVPEPAQVLPMHYWLDLASIQAL